LASELDDVGKWLAQLIRDHDRLPVFDDVVEGATHVDIKGLYQLVVAAEKIAQKLT
jgi:hypothetical protein